MPASGSYDLTYPNTDSAAFERSVYIVQGRRMSRTVLLSSHLHSLAMAILVCTRKPKQTVAMTKKVVDTPRMTGTREAGCSKFGTTPDGGDS